MADNYKAIVGKVRLVEIPGAKTLQLAYYNGLQFAVDKSMTEDQLYLIFPMDGQLSKEYAEANDLVRRRDPETGEQKGGFFELNRKVRTIKLMKGALISVGFIADLDTLSFTEGKIDKIQEGDEISEFNGVPICNKYINEATLRAKGGKNQPKKKRDYADMIGFAEHQDTSQFFKSSNLIEGGDTITVTLKLDGTSVRIGNPYLTKHKTLWNRFVAWAFNTNLHFNRVTVGTRRTVLNNKIQTQGFYGDNHSMYREPAEKIKELILPGETIYGEIVGWANVDKPLFKRGNMIFKYGCENGAREMYVYAIKHTMPNGYSYHLPWNLVKARCFEMGLKTVPEIPTSILPYKYIRISDDEIWSDIFRQCDDRMWNEDLSKVIEDLTHGADLIDPSHIREGVVVRVDKAGLNQTNFLKAKSAEYYALEDASKMDEAFVDTEEVES